MNKEKLNVVVFRNNLRIDDNYALFNALKNKENVLCLYPLEILEGTNLGFKSCGNFRKKLIFQAINELKETLNEKNIPLYCVKDISSSLKALFSNYSIKIFYEQEVGIEELEFEQKLENYHCESFYKQTMIEAFDIDVSKSFSNFRNKVEKALKTNKMQIQKPLEFEIQKQKETLKLNIQDEKLEVLSEKLILNGGEKEAFKRVDEYLSKYMHKYFDTRSLVDGFDNSTKFSVYLSIGCISARRVYQKLKEYESKSYESKSSYWIFFELLWRDYFHLVMKQSSNKLFLKTGLLENESYDFSTNSQKLQEFFDAKTGVDIIDAGVIELKTTGWVSNRLRQLLASYFVKNLGLDFRYGAAFFQEYLLDFSCASNYGNWAYQAGVGNDKQYRVFDPIKQSKVYKGKAYIKKFLNKEETPPSFDYAKMAEEVKGNIFKNKD